MCLLSIYRFNTWPTIHERQSSVPNQDHFDCVQCISNPSEHWRVDLCKFDFLTKKKDLFSYPNIILYFFTCRLPKWHIFKVHSICAAIHQQPEMIVMTLPCIKSSLHIAISSWKCSIYWILWVEHILPECGRLFFVNSLHIANSLNFFPLSTALLHRS